jgi:hypothetical protein
MSSYNMQYSVYLLLCVGSAGMASAKNVEFLAEEGQYSFIFSSAPSTRSPCTERCVLFSVIMHYKHDESSWSVRMLAFS